MKQLVFLISLFTIVNNSKAQSFRPVNLCHENNRLTCYRSDHYVLTFRNSELERIEDNDSMLVYYLRSNVLRILSKRNDTIVVDLMNLKIHFKNQKVDTLIAIPVLSPDKSCSGEQNFVQMFEVNGIFIVFGYKYCDLKLVSFMGTSIGSVNLRPKQSRAFGYLIFDAIFSPLSQSDSSSTSWLEIKRYAHNDKLDLIGFYHSDDTGYEFLMNGQEKVGEIRLVRKYAGELNMYQTLVRYKQNGKIRKSKYRTLSCACQ